MITFNNTSFRYGTDKRVALEKFSNKVTKGELILLLGASGSGKTTITRLINGLVPHFYDGELTGSIHVKNKITNDTAIQSLADVVGSVFQDPRSQFFATDVTTEIAFSCENSGMERSEIHSRVANVAEKLGIKHLLGRSIFALSSGEKQIVAIASVYAFAPEIIVMDEPSANLDPMATQKLREIIHTLQKEGFTVVISEHRIHYLVDLADRVLLIENGNLIKEYTGEDFRKLTNTEANNLGLRSLCLDRLTVKEIQVKSTLPVALEIKNLTVGYEKKSPLIQNLSVQVGVGEILGIVGHNGVGKSTLLEIICGLKKEQSGQILYQGKPLSSKKRIKETYLVMQDSDYQFFTEGVENELCLENIKVPEINKKALSILKELNLDDFKEHHPAALSGGQKQRLSIAVAYMKDVNVICFDEPTSGLDYQNMFRVRDLLKKMAFEGKTIIVITHDYEFLLATCTDILNIQSDNKSEYIKVSDQTCKRLAKVAENL